MNNKEYNKLIKKMNNYSKNFNTIDQLEKINNMQLHNTYTIYNNRYTSYIFNIYDIDNIKYELINSNILQYHHNRFESNDINTKYNNIDCVYSESFNFYNIFTVLKQIKTINKTKKINNKNRFILSIDSNDNINIIHKNDNNISFNLNKDSFCNKSIITKNDIINKKLLILSDDIYNLFDMLKALKHNGNVYFKIYKINNNYYLDIETFNDLRLIYSITIIQEYIN